MKKKKNDNWFVQQEEKKLALVTVTKKAPAKTQVKEIKNPILSVMEKSKKEDVHFKEALEFAQKVSSAKDDTLQTVHLTMEDVLVFNMKKDAHFKKLWESQQLALLVTFPCSWKSIPLSKLIKLLDLDMDAIGDFEEEDFEDWDDLGPEDRFDLLYETGLQVYEKA